MLIVVCFLVFCVIGLLFILVAGRFVAHAFRKQDILLLDYTANFPKLTETVQNMIDRNAFLFLNHITDAEVSEVFLSKFAEAWTIVSARPDFKALNLSIGFSFNKTAVSNSTKVKAERDGFSFPEPDNS